MTLTVGLVRRSEGFIGTSSAAGDAFAVKGDSSRTKMDRVVTARKVQLGNEGAHVSVLPELTRRKT